ncbi:MAG TPA: diaminopimelate epimerase [Candidatus Methanofastidiosa archaeon]|nr:diaminopimelate epimerase [Candidatus Methanofastidiosa archaeon]
MKFTKMEGLGNDYVYIDLFSEDMPSEDLPELARKLSDRHFGIGSDGIVLILPSDTEDCRMRIFNSDGSEAEMCGNGVRCVAKLMYDGGRHNAGTVRIETLAGTIVARVKNRDAFLADVEVDMGEPILEAGKIPVSIEGERAIQVPIGVDGEELVFTAVSMGNPHCVIFVDGIEDRMIERWGPLIERHPMFPERTNVEFVKVLDDGNIQMRVWERGAGETLACGTGACASVVACIVNGLCGHDVSVRLLGGTLRIRWQGQGPVIVNGPARIVFTGEIIP